MSTGRRQSSMGKFLEHYQDSQELQEALGE